MRVSATLLAAAIFAAPAFADKEATGPIFEPDTYRFGGTYSIVSSRSASHCASTCGGDTSCKAWSFVDLPGASAQNACELKSTLGKSEVNPTSVSGISPRLEQKYQPSLYGRTTSLAGGRTVTTTSTSRTYSTARPAPSSPATVTSRAPVYRSAPSAPATVRTAPPKRMSAPAAPATVTSRAPTRISAPAAPATITTQAPTRVAAPAAPATITSTNPVRASAPAAPATITSTSAVRSTAPAAPATITSSTPPRRAAPAAPAVVSSVPKSPAAKPTPVAQPGLPADRSAPIAINAAPTAPTSKPAQPTVQFQPLKRSVDGTYVPTKPKTVSATPAEAAPKSRVVLTGPVGDDVAKAVHGRVVLNGEMTAASSGGVGETPSAPVPRNGPVTANGERVPYKDISARDYPDYSVTRAAEQGTVDPVGTEDTGSTLPEAGS